MAEEVKVLRSFRDNVLLTNSLGRSFVRLYYDFCPPVADFIAKRENLRAVVRWSLLPLVGVSWLAIKIGSGLTLAIIAVLFSTMCSVSVVFTRRRRLRKHMV